MKFSFYVLVACALRSTLLMMATGRVHNIVDILVQVQADAESLTFHVSSVSFFGKYCTFDCCKKTVCKLKQSEETKKLQSCVTCKFHADSNHEAG